MRKLTAHILMIAHVVAVAGCSEFDSSTPSQQAVPHVANRSVAPLVEDLDGGTTELLLSEAESNLATVVIFTRTDCPVGNRFSPTISRLQNEFETQGFRFALVYPIPDETADDIRKHAVEYGLKVPCFRDPEQGLVEFAGVTVTPEAVVWDNNSRMLYRGRIDNRVVELGKERPQPTINDLHNTLKSIADGETPSFHTTTAIGCFIERD